MEIITEIRQGTGRDLSGWKGALSVKQISIGKQSFGSMRKQDCFYVDKTGFIKEWWESQDDVTLITRPRRFGKTLNMDMLNCFFSNQYEGRHDLFEGLSIWEDEKYRELQGTYPVIFLSFAAVKTKGYRNARKQICELLFSLYEDHRYLLEGDILSDSEKTAYHKIVTDMDDASAATSLQQLMKYLSRYYNKKVIVLLDEYDTPMQEAYVGGYWDEMVGFIRSLFNATFKTNPYLERAVMTGITRVSKESIFSDLNNLKVITTTSSKYGEFFGFTEEEVFHALDDYGMGDQKENVKKWYDGFTFGKYTDIYNPWSITNYLDERRLGTYWANTSSNGLISTLIQQGNTEVKETMEDLLQGGSLVTEIDEEIVFHQLDMEENAIWSLMLASGYLKVLHSEFPADGRFRYELGVTNFEVQIMLKNMIRNWFKTGDSYYNDFIKALLLGDMDAMNEFMNEVALQSFSSFDTAKNASGKDDAERFYHGFVLGLMVDLSDRYHVISNRESGFGRYDIMLKPLDKTQDAIIIEFKVHKPKREASLEETVQAALKQIQDKRYNADLLAEGFAQEQIRCYGFAFRGKEVLIG